MIRSDEQQDRRDHYTEYGRVCRPFRLKCSVFDIADIEYILDVEFKEIIDDVFEAKVLDSIPPTAEYVFEDINNYFSSFIDNTRATLQKVYDNFNHEIK